MANRTNWFFGPVRRVLKCLAVEVNCEASVASRMKIANWITTGAYPRLCESESSRLLPSPNLLKLSCPFHQIPMIRFSKTLRSETLLQLSFGQTWVRLKRLKSAQSGSFAGIISITERE